MRKLTIAFVALLLALAGFEAAVRALGLDWKLLAKQTYWYDSYPQLHIADPHPELGFRLRPNSEFNGVGHYGSYSVHINSLGARGREQSARPAPGVFRIVCLGGSNVFGTEVGDDQTWPAQLEKTLNESGDKRFEVVNLGTSAQVMAQSVFLAREALANLQPDLLLFGLSNTGKQPFLMGSPLAAYFTCDPSLWGAQLGGLASWNSARRLERWFLKRSAVFRSAALIMNRRDGFEERNVEAFHRFFVTSHREFLKIEQKKAWRREGVKKMFGEVGEGNHIVLVIGPYVADEDLSRYALYSRGFDVPVFRLAAPDSSPEYRMLHPPPSVLAWQAAKIAAWLRETGLVSRVQP